MKYNARTLRLRLLDEIEMAINYGYSKAYKYSENPDEIMIKGHIYDAVESAIYEWINFEDIE